MCFAFLLIFVCKATQGTCPLLRISNFGSVKFAVELSLAWGLVTRNFYSSALFGRRSPSAWIIWPCGLPINSQRDQVVLSALSCSFRCRRVFFWSILRFRLGLVPTFVPLNGSRSILTWHDMILAEAIH